ncbi:nitronate monooxygenase [Microbacterium sp. X-17]|uniref:NAD(P)H-dependent flavin oxidoreductase n=1 Tax=Microbacterium sp. X-17 TaxID=3144404 RepID=UPI0031F4AF66
MIRTDLTQLLRIEHPVLSAGMARVAQADLVVAVSEAGGMGCLGGVSFMPAALQAEIKGIKDRTTKPYAVNLLLPESLTTSDEATWAPVRELWEQMNPAQRTKLAGVEALLTPGAVKDQVDVVLAECPPVVVLTFATPKWFIEAARQRGITIGAMVGSIGAAQRAAESGADFLVAQGTEGGGHTGYIATMALTPAVVDAVSIPVAAAGGITDGRGLAASLSLGAGGVWVGSRFIATPEAYGHGAFKQRVVAGHSRDTILTKSYTGKPLRAFRNEWTTRWESQVDSIKNFPAQYAVAAERVETGYQDGDLDEGMMPIGQGVENIHEITPAGDIVRSMVNTAERVITSLRASIA